MQPDETLKDLENVSATPIWESDSLFTTRVLSPQEFEHSLSMHRLWAAGQPDSNPADLSLSNLTAIRFPPGIDLSGARLVGVDLHNQDLREANLSDCDLRWSQLSGTNLTAANLARSNLSGVDNLLPAQLAGTNLSGATLPTGISAFDAILKGAEGATATTGKISFSLLVVLLTTLLYAGTVSDLTLLENLPAKGLPFGSVEVSYLALSILVPAGLMVVQLYLMVRYHLVWRLVATLPAIFPDGRRIDEIAFQWVGIGVSRGRLRTGWAVWDNVWSLQDAIDSVLIWWCVPLTLLLVWLRCLVCHNWYLSFLQLAFVAMSLVLAIQFRYLAFAMFAQDRKKTALFQEGAPVWVRGGVTGFAVFAILSAISYALMFSPVAVSANLRDAEVSRLPSNRSRTDLKAAPESALQQIIPANLQNRDLRNCDASGAFLVNANLRFAHLNRCNLSNADMRLARVEGADFAGALLEGSDFRFVDLRQARGLTKAVLQTALTDSTTLLPTEFAWH
jgi:uncharacterized protein YjbI with pentapeptide repeats